MAIYNLPYNPQADPNALFARGLTTAVAGYNQGRERNRVSDFAQGMDPNANGMQIFQDALRAGLPMEVAVGMAGIQNKSQQRIGSLPGWWNQATPQQQQGYMGRVGGPLVQVGSKLLSEPTRKTAAELENAEKIRAAQVSAEEDEAKRISRQVGEPLTVTETKGVDTIVKAVLGESKALPFGIMPGPAKSQEDLEVMWENVKDQTQYEARGSVAKKKIRSSFDIRVGILNKGKGVATLKGQYAWDRKAYNLKLLQPYLEGVDAEGARLATKAINEGAEPEEIIEILKKRNPELDTPTFPGGGGGKFRGSSGASGTY